MKKIQAIKMFGGRDAMARALGVTGSAISQWPAELKPEQVDRVMGAALRLELLPCNSAAVVERIDSAA